MLVKCENCINHKYCPEYCKMIRTKKEADRIAGCVSGEPKFLPKKMAEKFSYEINKIAKDCGIDKKEYLEDIVKEIREI